MRKLLPLFVLLSACSTNSIMELSSLPNIYITDTKTCSNTQIYPQTRPENALDYSKVDTIQRSNSYNLSIKSNKKSQENVETTNSWTTGTWYTPSISYKFNNIIVSPETDNYAPDITYKGDSFIKNSNDFAEQTTGVVQDNNEYNNSNNYGYTNTKLVLGGGLSYLEYTDFGYWLGIPTNNTNPVAYFSFNIKGENEQATSIVQNDTVFTGKAAAIAYDKSKSSSARELGGTATLTFNNSGNSNLNLNFNDYYTFEIISNKKDGSNISSVIVNGSNTNSGPAFNSCLSGCSSKVSADYSYFGDAYQIKEASGTYKYTDGNNILLGSFGAKKN